MKKLYYILLLFFFKNFINNLEIYVTLNPKQVKCIKERINKDTLAVATFKTNDKKMLMSVYIFDIDVNEKSFVSTSKNIIFESVNEHDVKTTFTTYYESTYSFCTINNANKKINIKYEIKHGTEAKDYTRIAKTEHLNESTVHLKKIIDQMSKFHKNLIRIKKLQEDEKTNADKLHDLLICFSIISIVIIVITAILQDIYFKKFFASKKII